MKHEDNCAMFCKKIMNVIKSIKVNNSINYNRVHCKVNIKTGYGH